MNEVSNGPAGNQEYVEFVVVSNSVTYSCSSTTPPCIDIRGWIFDDNSGYHGAGGVATGAVRFSQNALWSCVPLGTIIVIYNNADPNPAMPADDLSLSDGNCRIIAPLNSTLFESNATTPGAVACSYPAAGWTAGGNWNNTVLANTGDCARIVNLAGCEVFSVCWATDNQNNLIYFSSGGSGSQNVWYFNGGDPTIQANWSEGSASPSPGNQTPGAPNNAANASYIAQFNNGCTPITPINVTASSVNAGCTCNGSATASASGSIGGYTYVWYDSGFNPIGQTSVSATGLCAGVYYVIATSHIGCTDTASVTITSSGATTVSVNSQTICSGSSATLTATPSVSGGTYSWTPGGQATQTISINPSSTTTYTVTYTLSGCSTTGNGTVTVNLKPVVTSIPNITVCNNGSVLASVFASTPAGATFAWTNSNTAIGLGASGSGDTPAFTATNATSSPITGTITVTPTLNTCTGTPVTYTITVNPIPTVTVPSDITVCNNGSISATSFTSNVAGAAYAWTNSNTAIGLAASGSGNIGTFTATNTGTSAITATITVTATANSCSGTPSTYSITVNPIPVIAVNSPDICNGASAVLTATGGTTYSWNTGSTANPFTVSPAATTSYTVTGTSGGCSGTAVSTVTVNPVPTVTVPSNIIVCNNATIAATSFTSSPSGATFSWTNSNTSIGIAASGTGNIPSFTATNATSSPVTATISVTPTLNGCSGTPVTYTIMVNPTPVINPVSNITVCNSAIVPASVFTSTPAGATFTWTNSNTVTGLAASGSGNISSFTATNTTSSSISSTISVTPTFNGCVGSPISYAITVDPTPNVTVPSNIAVCAGATIAATNFSGTTTGTTYAWTNSNAFIGIAASGSGDIPSFTTTNASGSPVTAIITVTPSANGCVGIPGTYTITVNPVPVVTVNSPSICPAQTATLTAAGAATYSWNTGSTTNPLTVSPASTTSYTVTGTSAGCSSTAVSTVTVASALSITVNSPSICNGATANLTASGATSYTWSAGATSTGINTADASPITTASYTVTGTTGSCTGTAVSTVTVNANPVVTINSPVICNGTTASLTAGGAITYTWSAGATSTGINTADASPTSTTTYTVTGTTSGCSGTALSTVTVNTVPVVIVNSPSICNGSVAALVANGATVYSWTAGAVSTGVNTADALPSITTSYTVTGTSFGCSATTIAIVTVTDIPVVTVNSPSICNGDIANLVANGASTYSWTVGASPTGVNTANASPAITSSYTVTGTTSGCSNTAVSTVTVNPAPVVTVTVNPPSVCPGTVANLTAGGATSYTWSAGANPTGPNTADVTPASTAFYSVTGTSSGCSSTAVATVTVLPAVAVSVNSPTICARQTANLSASGATLYTWSAGATPTGTSTADVSPIATTSYTVTGSAAGTCSGTAVSVVTVSPLPPVVVNSPSICYGQVATLTAGGASSYSWSVGATYTGVSTADASPLATTSYTVTGTALSCSATAIAVVLVQPLPNPVFASDVITGCAPLCVNFSDSSTIASGNIVGWNWNFSDGSATTPGMGPRPSHCFANAGIYPIVLTDTSSAGCIATSTIVYNITVNPVPDAAFTAPSSASIFDPSVTYTDESTIAAPGTITSWHWNFGDALAAADTSDIQNPTHVFSDAGTYCALLIVKSNNDCYDTVSACIVIEGEFTFYAPNAFSPNDNNINDTFLPKGTGWQPDTYRLSIFDRWGNMCFSTQEINKGWDGKANNGSEIAQIDTYVWKVEVKDIFGKPHKYLGKVTIVK